MTKTLLFSSLIFTLFSCNKNVKSEVVKNNQTSHQTAISSEKKSNKNLEIKLDLFKTVPDTIDGCGEYYTLESENDNSKNYIFLSNLSNFAIIKVSGKNVFLQKDSINSKEISKDEYLEIYSGNGFKATLKIKVIKKYDEGGFYKGTLKINNKEKETDYKIKGESGC
ncbi:hypothetical protein GJU43_19770 [Flavobacterium sp. LC2016-23]|uniref:hypothetical protein n=1 Tax=Flavobacterium sp. LC2016-23 TaxID=2666330 RepID=UPI0012AF30F3|nr:hypothetical protein [Flavobacterium sp. LC2016-23]MRX41528.1 hypothetical protein [Flavobacterium sp. LC2016-23]